MKLDSSLSQNSGRIEYFDILRGLAIIMVVLIHSTNYYSIEPEGNAIGMIIWRNALCFAVPLFITLSGYLLATKDFSKDGSYSAFLKRQIPRVLIPYLIWGLVYSLIAIWAGSSLSAVIIKFLTFQASVPLYFIGVIIQLYYLLPIVQKLANTRGLIITGTMSLLFCLGVYLMRYHYGMTIPVFAFAGTFIPWMFFNVLGVYFGQGKRITKKTVYLLLLSIFSFVVLMADSNFEFMRFKDYKSATSTIRVTSLIFCFFIISWLFSLKSADIKNRFVSYIGVISSGIYFSHMIFLTLFGNRLPKHLPGGKGLAFQILLPMLVSTSCWLLCHSLRSINRNIAAKYLGM